MSIPSLSGFSGGNLLSQLRRTWIVIYGEDAPQPEKDGAAAIAQYMRQSKFNLCKAMSDQEFLGVLPGTPGGWFGITAGVASGLGGSLDSLGGGLPTTFQGLGLLGGGSGPLLNKIGVNLILVGGPLANEVAWNLNDYLEPRFKYTVALPRNPGEKWSDYVNRGGLQFNGVLVNNVLHNVPAAPNNKWGFIATGVQPTNRLRPLQVTHLCGVYFEDTCTMVKAFLAGETGPNMYRNTWTDMGTYNPPYTVPTACPPDSVYIKATLP